MYFDSEFATLVRANFQAITGSLVASTVAPAKEGPFHAATLLSKSHTLPSPAQLGMPIL
jgi:hypothetical protein